MLNSIVSMFAEAFASSMAARSVHSGSPSLLVPPVSQTPSPGLESTASPVELTTRKLPAAQARRSRITEVVVTVHCGTSELPNGVKTRRFAAVFAEYRAPPVSTENSAS